jgi:hypothetical protein
MVPNQEHPISRFLNPLKRDDAPALFADGFPV